MGLSYRMHYHMFGPSAVRKTLISLLVLANSFTTVYAAGSDTRSFLFRYKVGFETNTVQPEDDLASKTITASFVGGVGFAFSEKLPLKPEWEDDLWQVDAGQLPDGVQFKTDTQTFEGTPTTEISGLKATLYGYDTSGVRIAKANVSFDIATLPENAVKVDLYAHTNKHFAKSISLPTGITVDNWIEVKTPPPGIDFNGRFVDGIPAKSGPYPILNIGLDYMGRQVFAYYGSITVEDGPVFAHIEDNLKEVSWYYSSAKFFLESVPKVKRTIGDPKKVRYTAEVAAGQKMPGSLKFVRAPYETALNGSVPNYYDQTVVRLRAEDVDGTVGFSNWYKVGSLGPEGICVPIYGSEIPLQGTVGSKFYSSGYKVPSGRDTGVKAYTLTSGELPNGLSLSPDTGLISGTPTLAGVAKDISFKIEFPNNAEAAPVNCGPYKITVSAADFALDISGDKDQYRVNEDIDVKLTATDKPGGLIQPYSVTMSDSTLPSTVAFDPTQMTIKGNVETPGDYTAKFTLTNGDGATRAVWLSFTVHDKLKIDDVPTVATIRQLAVNSELVKVTYDASTIIGLPKLELIGGPLPKGFETLQYNSIISGGTTLPVGQYGPFNFRLSDGSGQKVDGNAFYIDVIERDDLIAGQTADPLTYAVNFEAKFKPFEVAQPPLATGLFPLNYSLTGPNLPEGLIFKAETGEIAGTPKKKSISTGYAVRISETSPANLSKTSETFSIVVEDAPPIGDIKLPILEGNKEGVSVASADPSAILGSPTNVKRLVGGLASVKYVSATPDVPGLTFNPSTGQIIGLPTSVFEGDVTISFHDGDNRSGSLILPVKIYPYPALKASESKFMLPRLATADNLEIKVEANEGFYKGVSSYKLTPSSGKLPDGLTLSATGQIVGDTSAPVGTVASIEVAATSKANGLEAKAAFDLEIAPRVPVTFDIPTTYFQVWLKPTSSATGTVVKVTKRDAIVLSKYFKGSALKPISYSFDATTAPDWLVINPTNGTLSGTPKGVGDWNVAVSVTDGEKTTTNGTVKLRATLDGFVTPAPGGESFTVRESETFKTSEQTLANVVAPAKFLSTNIPASMTLNEVTGQTTGRLDKSGNYSWTMNVKDSHDRTLRASLPMYATAIKPLKLNGIAANNPGKQYDAATPVNVVFREALFQMGEVGYAIIGDVPGTLFHKYVDKNTQLATFIRYSDNQNIVARIDQLPGQDIAMVMSTLPNDAILFDTTTLRLSGIASRQGTFNAKLIAFDNHAEKYIDKSDPTRAANNSAELDFQITVSGPVEMSIANTASSETLDQYTSQATIQTVVKNSAYGKGVTWTRVSGELPQNVVGVNLGSALGYGNYPEEQGTFSNIVWKAKDAIGREITSDPVTLIVGPRKPMELIPSTAIPRTMVVFDQDAQLTVRAKNAAYGPSLGVSNWTVIGAQNLPQGVTHKVSADNVTFAGKSDKIGTYSGIKIVGVDKLGARAEIDLTFRVIANPEPIILNVFDVITKAGFPIAMSPPYALGTLSTDNTYGAVRFYSYDLPSELTLNASSGTLSGSINPARDVTFDLFVTDDTNRVTSKPVNVTVIPFVRTLVPSQIAATQGVAVKQAVSTDYALGVLNYAKGNGQWPEGTSVDPKTGAISGTITAAAGTYEGLTIAVTDTFGSNVDTQQSNAFSFVVAPGNAAPDIADPTRTVLGVKGSPIAGFKPTVREKGKSTIWTYAQTKFTSNYDLSEYGLQIDEASGAISGTPTKAFILRDFTITVTSQRGDTDTTKPFWIGVQPDKAMELDPKFKTSYAYRKPGRNYSDPVAVLNYVGNLTFSKVTASSRPLDANTGQYYTDTYAIAATTVSWTRTVKATDEFGRTFNFDLNFSAYEDVTLQVDDFTIVPDDEFTITPVATNVIGAPTYSAVGLPSGVSINSSTGVITGKMSTSALKEGDSISYTVTIRDGLDGATKSSTAQIKMGSGKKYKHWLVAMDPSRTGSGNGAYSAIWEIQLYSKSGENLSLRHGKGTAIAASSPTYYSSGANADLGRAFDGTKNTTIAIKIDPTTETPKAGKVWLSLTFAQPEAVDKVWFETNNTSAYGGRYPKVYGSEDGLVWEYVMGSSINYAVGYYIDRNTN